MLSLVLLFASCERNGSVPDEQTMTSETPSNRIDIPSNVRNNLDIDLAGFVNTLREQRKISIDGGYGKMKGKTFRISNMGDETKDSISHLLGQMDDILGDFMPS